MNPQTIFQSLLHAREQAVKREFAAYDAPDDGLDKAIDRMQAEERRRRESNAVLVNVTKGAERKGPHRI